MGQRLLVISPIRNEAEHLERVVRAMAAQSGRRIAGCWSTATPPRGPRDRLESVVWDWITRQSRLRLLETTAAWSVLLQGENHSREEGVTSLSLLQRTPRALGPVS